ncbi:hypothetical protein [Paenibacillus contaminans]|nr:hypothetical protein [Paenibacillus contaminans]
MCRSKYPLQAGVFGLQTGKGSCARFQVGKIEQQCMQAMSGEE